MIRRLLAAALVAFAVAAGAQTQSLVINAGGGAAGGGGALSAITAATGANTIGSGNNTGQVWNWANTTDATTAFRFGETSAATNGTVTSGFANQVGTSFESLAASTSSPFQVKIRGTTAMQASSTATQMVFANGAVGTPAISFAASGATGFYSAAGNIGGAVGGAAKFNLGATGMQVPSGGITDVDNFATTTIAWPVTNAFNISGNEGEWVRWVSRVQQASRGSADATAYALNFRKSRGTVAAPTVITTADALHTISGFGYVGGTNTYLEATRIESDSTGTIADATTGIGGILRFYTTKAGTDTAVQEGFRLQGGSVPQTVYANGTIASPTIVGQQTANAGLFFRASGETNIAGGGTEIFRADGANQQIRIFNGSTTVPGLSSVTTGTSGLTWGASSAADLSQLIASTETTRLDANGHLNFLKGPQSAAPTVTANCGTSPTVTGNDSVFTLNVGTGGTATTCTITFNKTWTNAPHCFVNNQGAGINTKAVPSTGTVIISEPVAWAASTLLDVMCIGHL